VYYIINDGELYASLFFWEDILREKIFTNRWFCDIMKAGGKAI
jgi:hypothetical protein